MEVVLDMNDSFQHGMNREQSVRILDRGSVKLAAGFPGEKRFSKLLSQSENFFRGSTSARRILALLLKACGLASGLVIRHPETNAAASIDVGEQFLRLAILFGTRIEKVQCQLIANEEKAIFPVLDSGSSNRAHFSLDVNVATPIRELYTG